jgi:hypothetical protein
MLKKLVIVAFTDNHYEKSAGVVFTAQINPEKYTENLSVKFESESNVNPAGITPTYKGKGARRMSLDFLLDDTGVLPDNSYESNAPQTKTVVARIQSFTDVAYKSDGGIHRPRYLRILWGALVFNCVLEKLDVDYTLFDPRGMPLRALLKAVFLHYAAADKLALEARNKSSDLTHYRRVAVGDTLPLMCQQVYGDSSLYFQIARRNALTNFRRLTENQWIEFPPKDELLSPARGA